MRVGTILEDTNEQEGSEKKFLVYTGMANGLTNLLYPRENGVDNRLYDPALVGTGKRFVPVGYFNPFGEESLPSILAKIGAKKPPVKAGDLVVVTDELRDYPHNGSMCEVVSFKEEQRLYELRVVSEEKEATLLLPRSKFRSRREVPDSIFRGYERLLRIVRNKPLEPEPIEGTVYISVNDIEDWLGALLNGGIPSENIKGVPSYCVSDPGYYKQVDGEWKLVQPYPDEN